MFFLIKFPVFFFSCLCIKIISNFLGKKNFIDWELIEEFENSSIDSCNDTLEKSNKVPPKRCYDIWEQEKDNNPIQHYRTSLDYFNTKINDQQKKEDIESRQIIMFKREEKIEEMKKRDEGNFCWIIVLFLFI